MRLALNRPGRRLSRASPRKIALQRLGAVASRKQAFDNGDESGTLRGCPDAIFFHGGAIRHTAFLKIACARRAYGRR